MGRFCILNFTEFSQNRILTMRYCSVKDCISTSSCKNVILHMIKEKWIEIVKWKTDSPSRICSRHFENKCYRSLCGKKLWNNAVACTIDLVVTTDFHVQVIKKDHNYTLPSSKESIQLLQESAEMGMRVRCYNVQNNLKVWKISRIHLKLVAKNIPSKKVPWSLLFASVSQIPGEIFQRIGERRKSSVKSNT